MGKTTEETSRRAKEAKGIWRKTLSFLMALLILFSISASALVERDPSEAQPAFAEQGESGVPPRLRLTPDGSGVELIFDERFTNRVDDFEQGESGVPPRLRLTPDGSGVKLVFDEGFTNRAEGFERIIERRAMPDGEKLYVILNPLLDCMVYDERGFAPFSQVGPTIIAPAQNQIIVETQNFPARWDEFPDATSYLVSLRNTTTNALPVDRVNVGNTTTFSIPSRYLYPGNHYRLAVAAVVSGQPIWNEPPRYFSVVPRTGEITIRYNGNGHTGGSPPPSHTVTTPGLGILRCPTRYGNMTRAGYTFGGWRLPGAGQVLQPGMGVLWESGFCGDFTVTAVWNRNTNMLNVPVIHNPARNRVLPWADVHVNWMPSTGATYTMTLRRLDTYQLLVNNLNWGTYSSVIIDRGFFTPGVRYRLTISATLGGRTEWYTSYFSIEGTSNVLNIPVIQRPTHNQILPWADVYIDWTPSNGATYRISLQRLDTLGMVINNFNLGTLSSIILDIGLVAPGVHYRLTISATLGGRTEWYTRYFSIAGQPQEVPARPEELRIDVPYRDELGLPLQDVYVRWTAAANQGQLLSLRDITTGDNGPLLYNRIEVNGDYFRIPGYRLYVGHRYRVAIAVIIDNEERWATRTFYIQHHQLGRVTIRYVNNRLGVTGYLPSPQPNMPINSPTIRTADNRRNLHHERYILVGWSRNPNPAANAEPDFFLGQPGVTIATPGELRLYAHWRPRSWTNTQSVNLRLYHDVWFDTNVYGTNAANYRQTLHSITTRAALSFQRTFGIVINVPAANNITSRRSPKNDCTYPEGGDWRFRCIYPPCNGVRQQVPPFARIRAHSDGSYMLNHVLPQPSSNRGVGLHTMFFAGQVCGTFAGDVSVAIGLARYVGSNVTIASSSGRTGTTNQIEWLSVRTVQHEWSHSYGAYDSATNPGGPCLSYCIMVANWLNVTQAVYNVWCERCRQTILNNRTWH